MILFSSEDCWNKHLSREQPTGSSRWISHITNIQTEERDSRRKLDETDNRKITVDLVTSSFLSHTEQYK